MGRIRTSVKRPVCQVGALFLVALALGLAVGCSAASDGANGETGATGAAGATGATGISAFPSASVVSKSVAEGNANHGETLSVNLSHASNVAVSCSYRLSAGSAAYGSSKDWTATATAGTLSFPAGQTTQTVALTVVGDSVVEGDETVRLDLSNPSAGLTLAVATGTLTITNDDSGRMARNVILIIGDGMNLSHEVAGSRYLYGSDYGLSFHQFDYKTYATTWDVTTYNKYAGVAGEASFSEANILASIGYDRIRGGGVPSLSDEPVAHSYFLSLVSGKEPATDSASAGTALSCGRKTDDGNIAWKTGDPDTGSYTTIAELARAAGMKIGVVSTVPFSHATPACFVSHNKSRNNYAAIATEILTTVKPDVVIGGGLPSPASFMDQTYCTNALVATVSADAAYTYVGRSAGVDGSLAITSAANTTLLAGKKLCGIFGGNGGNFEYYACANVLNAPLCTQGNAENPTLAACTEAALQVLTAAGNSTAGCFLMIEQGDIDWANHANHYPNMIGGIYDLDEAVKKAVAFVDRAGDQVDWTNTMIIVTADHSNSYMRLRSLLAKGVLPTVNAAGLPTDGTVSYATMNHTNEPVTVYAKGAGKDLFKEYEGSWNGGSLLVDNTHIFWVMARALGLSVPTANSQSTPLSVTAQE